MPTPYPVDADRVEALCPSLGLDPVNTGNEVHIDFPEHRIGIILGQSLLSVFAVWHRNVIEDRDSYIRLGRVVTDLHAALPRGRCFINPSTHRVCLDFSYPLSETGMTDDQLRAIITTDIATVNATIETLTATYAEEL